MKTTLNAIRATLPCYEGWVTLLDHLGKTKADDEPLSIATILDGNDLGDALWCLQAVKGYDREIRLFGVWCARQVQHLITDQRSLDALDVAERFANGDATESELAAARAAAVDAEVGASMANVWGDAAWAASGAVAWDAAWAASGAALRAAWVAASRDVRDVAWAASRDAQENRLRELCAECEAMAEA